MGVDGGAASHNLARILRVRRQVTLLPKDANATYQEVLSVSAGTDRPKGTKGWLGRWGSLTMAEGGIHYQLSSYHYQLALHTAEQNSDQPLWRCVQSTWWFTYRYLL